MQYRIEFFELTAVPTADITDAFQALTDLSGAPVAALKVGAYMRELWQLDANPRVVRGQFRKFRETDLPEIGRLGAEAEEIQLDDGQGLIEKNFFMLCKRQSLLVWHGNGHANTLKRLMAGDLVVRGLDVSVPRPRNVAYYPGEEFSQRLFDAMGAADGDRIRVSITTDARINDKPKLNNRIKKALKELVTDHAASTAKVQAIEDGIAHPIDLIADRITSMQEIEHEGRYPTARAMYQAFDDAINEEREAIDAVLGNGIA